MGINVPVLFRNLFGGFMEITREFGSKRGQAFLKKNKTHGKDGLPERKHRAGVGIDIQYCIEILRLTGGLPHIRQLGSPNFDPRYQKIETLDQAKQQVLDWIKKDNAEDDVRKEEEVNGAKRRCIAEVTKEQDWAAIMYTLESIQALSEFLPTTRANGQWAALVRDSADFKNRSPKALREGRASNKEVK